MATTRRVFLEILGAGAAASGCVAVVSGTPPDGFGSGGSGGVGTGGNGSTPITDNGTGGIGSGGASTNGQIGSGGDTGTGGAQQGSGGTTGSGGAQADSGTGGSTRTDAGAGDAQAVGDANVPPRDAGPAVLQPGDIAAGNIGTLQVGGLNAVSGRTVAIGRDAMGVYALTLVCTHQGCTAAPAGAVGARQVNCPCHGSQFDRNGAVIRGPAGRPLVHFAVTVDPAGNIIIHSTMQVAATVRTVA
jgi:Rieske Fe-S protein